MSENTFHGVPRSKIPWHPTIDYDKCISCGKCLGYCKHGVFQLEEKEGREVPSVRKPYNCVVYCTGCDAVCPTGAIRHPLKQEIGKLISDFRKNRLM